ISTGREFLLSLRKMALEKTSLLLNTKEQLSNICQGYAGIRAYIDKIKSACRRKDILLASYAANELQIWIAESLASFEGKKFVNLDNLFNLYEEIKTSYEDLGLPNLDKYVSSEDFTGLEDAINKLETTIQKYCGKQRELPLFSDFESLKHYFEEKK
ncbi:MAG: hypothetical protein ACFFBD_02855, partial [Candidatus Hodarchaeota archaeon]